MGGTIKWSGEGEALSLLVPADSFHCEGTAGISGERADIQGAHHGGSHPGCLDGESDPGGLDAGR